MQTTTRTMNVIHTAGDTLHLSQVAGQAVDICSVYAGLVQSHTENELLVLRCLNGTNTIITANFNINLNYISV